MRRVEQPDVELVAHVRPGDLARQFQVEPLLGREALVRGDEQRRRVDQRNEADAQLFSGAGHFNSSAAMTTADAISAIFFLSRIAAPRISR